MDPISISVLEGKLSSYREKLSKARKSLKSYNDAYESLALFRGVVQKDGAFFDSGKKKKELLLEELKPFVKLNNCIKTYNSAIKKLMNGIGTKVIDLAFEAFDALIGRTLKSYLKKVEELNDDILYYTDKIGDIEAEIRTQKELFGG